AGGDVSGITAALVFARAAAGDAVAAAVVDEACQALGAMIGTVVNGLNPEVVLVTGGVARSFAALEGRILAAAGEYALGRALAATRVRIDPAGITTYSIAGASLGYGMLWTAIVTFPLMAAVQLVCARIGLVSGRGLAGAIRRHYPRPFLYVACLLLLIANVFNIAADLSGMADVTHMLTGVPTVVSVPVLGLVILLATIYMTY